MLHPHLDGLVVDIQTEADSLMEGSHWFARAVDVNVLFRLNGSFLVVNGRLDDSVTNGLVTHRSVVLKSNHIDLKKIFHSLFVDEMLFSKLKCPF